MRSISPVYTKDEVQFEHEIAKDQPAYIPVIGLPVTLQIIDPRTFEKRELTNWAIAVRFEFSDEERAAVAAGQDLVVTQLVFGKPLSPMNIQICKSGEKPLFEMAMEEPEPATQPDPLCLCGIPKSVHDGDWTAKGVPACSNFRPANNILEMPALPSADDLDAAAAEQSIADATGSTAPHGSEEGE